MKLFLLLFLPMLVLSSVLSDVSPAKGTVVKVDDTDPIQQFAQTLKPKLPKGWTVAINQKTLAIERDQKVQVMPYFGRRAKSPDETEDEYFKDMGSIIKLDIVLRFEPRMSEASWLKLSARRADLLESGKDGFRNKTELSEHSALIDKYQLPSFETRDSSIFQTPLRHYYELRDDQVRQELSEVQAILNKALPANRGMIAIADQPKIRWPTVWVNTEPTASFSINKTTAQPLTADQAVKQFSNDAETGFINPKWGETIDWKDAPDFEAWIEANPRRARLTQKPRNPKPRASIVRLSKRQVEVKVIRTAGLHMGRTHFAVAKHFRIPRTREVDATFGLPALEVEHLTTFKGIGKGDKQDRVLKQLGKPDHSRRLQNGDWYDYYFDDDITLFYHLRHVHSLSFTVPPAVKQQAKESPQADK